MIILAATVGIVVASLSGGKDDGTTQNKSTLENTATATRIPGNYCFEDSYDLTYSDAVVNSFVDMIKATPFECADPTAATSAFREQWLNCEILKPICCQDDDDCQMCPERSQTY